MRGYLIEIVYDPEDVGALNANDFIGTRDGQTFAEWYEDGDEQECTRVFQDKFTKYGAVFGREEGGPLCIVFRRGQAGRVRRPLRAVHEKSGWHDA